MSHSCAAAARMTPEEVRKADQYFLSRWEEEEDWILHDRIPLTRGWLGTKALQTFDVVEVEYVTAPDPSPLYEPRTALGKRLWAIRERAVADGMKLLTPDEIVAELEARRGERHR